MESVWEKVKAELKAHIPASNFMMWIEPLELKDNDETRVVLGCPNQFSQKWIQGYYRDLIATKFSTVSGKPYQLSLEVMATETRPAGKDAAETSPSEEKRGRGRKKNNHQLSLPQVHVRPQTGRLLKKEFTFDNFVVGESNDFAYSAVLSMGSSRNAFNNSLFLTSQSGMGKSHLAQSLGHQYLSSDPGARVYYLTAEDFSNEMVYAFNTKSINKFKERFRAGYDMLLIEDLHALAGKERTQTELSQVLDYMMEADKKVLFTGCCLPGEIPRLNKQLQSRLSSGLITAMDRPDFNTRVRILRKKCQLHGYVMPRVVLEYLADNLSEDVRQLESGLTSLAMKSSLLGVPIDIELAESVVKTITVLRRRITLDAIKKLACAEYGIPVRDIESRSRRQPVAWARQVAVFLSRRYTDHSLKAIGRCYNRYHATVIHSVNIVESAMKTRQSVRQEINRLAQKLEEGGF
ncbi:MAG: chromosomal replication initiator protein DnaA [Desulfosudaceae bacterium]